MNLTSNQQQALSAFNDFIQSNDQVFLLKGSAGTGKTTLVKEIIDSLPKGGGDFVGVHLMAPTGRAAMVLAKKVGLPAMTIHRTIYNIDEDLSHDKDGKMYFKLRENNAPRNTLYIVDESSMVSDRYSENDAFLFGSGYLMKDLLQYCGGRKIVFVGDYAQLPPVGQSFSPAMDVEYLRKQYGLTVREVMLREVVRQDNESGIYLNATRVRDWIENKIFNEFNMVSSPDVQISDNLVEDYMGMLDRDMKYRSILLAYTNQQVLDYNLSIRGRLFENGQRLNEGDLLVVARNNYGKSGVDLYNGQIVKVVKCDDDDHLEKEKVRFNTNENGKPIVKEMALVYRKITIETDDKQQHNYLLLDNYLDNDYNDLHLHQAMVVEFSKRYDGSRNDEDEYLSAIRSDLRYNALLCKYGYAITCHKAQGGEWENVFVDFDNFSSNANSSFFRWAYTAITRSSKQLWHFASPDFNAISKMVYKDISRGGKPSVSLPKGVDVKQWRVDKIKQQCEKHDIRCEIKLERPYQQNLLFSRNADSCELTFYLDAKSYTGQVSRIRSSNDEFEVVVRALCERTLIPDSLAFEPKSDAAALLHKHVMAVAQELGVPVTDIRQEQYKDTYFFKTEANAAQISFFYNSKGIYSKAMPMSTDGDNDLVLANLCKALQ